MSPEQLSEELRLGIVQTAVDNAAAWSGGLQMSNMEEERAISEIQQHLFALGREDPKSQIILLPELSVPLGFLPRLRRAAATLNAVIIAGMDFQTCSRSPPARAVNRAAVIVPNGWGRGTRSTMTTLRFVGKTYPAHPERENLAAHGYEFQCIPEVWVFDACQFGRFAVAICYDFLDLERVAMYRLNIQHLFIVSYNMDTTSFNHAAEALARMIFCNVVVCNTGWFGGSLAVSPYKRPERRLIYHHAGARLSTSQSIILPVRALYEHQHDLWPHGKPREFKSLPPGAGGSVALQLQEEALSP